MWTDTEHQQQQDVLNYAADIQQEQLGREQDCFSAALMTKKRFPTYW